MPQKPDTAKITRRTRSLGYGWTTQPRRDRAAIEDVRAPTVRGSWREVAKERARCHRITSGGTWYREALYLDGRRVVACRTLDTGSPAGDVLAALEEYGEAIVELAPEEAAPRSRGRRPLDSDAETRVFTVRLPESLIARIHAAAEERNVPASAFIRGAVEAALATK